MAKKEDNAQRASGEHNPTKRGVYLAARAYLKAGLSLIPITADGEKRPAWMLMPPVWCEETCKRKYPWSPFKNRRPTREEVRNWFGDPNDRHEFGLAIIGGKVSGGLEIIDCDNWDVGKRWMSFVRRRAPVLIDKLVLVKSPRPGLHAYYRCSEFGGNQKLARVPDGEKDNKKPKTVIELKGEGGYCLAPPSPASCHPTGRCYTIISRRDFTEIPTISPRERQVLLDCARKLNCWLEPPRLEFSPKPQRSQDGQLLRPGDDFNRRADWADILGPHGWAWAGRGCDDSDRWRRPGKSEGWSATANFGGSDLLYVFSSNADPFEEATAYTKFYAFTLLNHEGDYAAAAKALAALGYGGPRPSRCQDIDPFARYATYKQRSKSSSP